MLLSVLSPLREIQQANSREFHVSISHQRKHQNSFNFYQRGTFLPHPSHCGFLTPPGCGCELWWCLDVHIMLCPSLAAGCCGLTSKVSRAVMLKPFLPDTLLKNVNELGQTRLQRTHSLTQSRFLKIYFCVLSRFCFILTPLHISESWIHVSDSCQYTSPFHCSVKLPLMIVISSIFCCFLAVRNSTNCALLLCNRGLIFRQYPRARWCSLCRIGHCAFVCVCLSSNWQRKKCHYRLQTNPVHCWIRPNALHLYIHHVFSVVQTPDIWMFEEVMLYEFQLSILHLSVAYLVNKDITHTLRVKI